MTAAWTVVVVLELTLLSASASTFALGDGTDGCMGRSTMGNDGKVKSRCIFRRSETDVTGSAPYCWKWCLMAELSDEFREEEDAV